MTYTHLKSRVNSLRTYTFFAVLLFVFLPTVSFALTPIAHTDVVPYQRIEYGTSFNFGVVAFSKAGIDRVDFAISGQGYSGGTKSSSSMALNTRVASTSPGAEYPGVYEYYVTISASEFTSNGMITVTPTVNGNDGGTKSLPAVTLYVEGANDESPTEAWVDANTSDGAGTLNNDADPFPTISSAISAIETANGDCDYAVIYLAEDTYNTDITGSTITSDEWLTITRKSGADIAKVIIDEYGTSYNTNHLKMKGITLRSTGSGDKALSRDGAWIDQCRMIGPGRGYSFPHPVSGSGNYYTSSYIYAVRFGIEGQASFVRGLDVHYLDDDFFQNKRDFMAVNCKVDDTYGTYDENHTDIIQIYSNPFDNIIVYNLVATNIQYQSIFLNAGDGAGGGSTNWALVNCLFEIRTKTPGGGRGWIHDKWNHLLLWHCTFGAYFPSDFPWGTLWLADYGNDGDDMEFDNTSFIGNVFRSLNIEIGDAGYGNDFLDSGNSYGNEASYNHYEETRGYEAGENYTTGTGVLDFDTPGSDTFGYPVDEAIIIDRLPSNLTGVMCDAYGNPRDSRPDVGALEAGSGTASSLPSAPRNLSVID